MEPAAEQVHKGGGSLEGEQHQQLQLHQEQQAGDDTSSASTAVQAKPARRRRLAHRRQYAKSRRLASSFLRSQFVRYDTLASTKLEPSPGETGGPAKSAAWPARPQTFDAPLGPLSTGGPLETFQQSAGYNLVGGQHYGEDGDEAAAKVEALEGQPAAAFQRQQEQWARASLASWQRFDDQPVGKATFGTQTGAMLPSSGPMRGLRESQAALETGFASYSSSSLDSYSLAGLEAANSASARQAQLAAAGRWPVNRPGLIGANEPPAQPGQAKSLSFLASSFAATGELESLGSPDLLEPASREEHASRAGGQLASTGSGQRATPVGSVERVVRSETIDLNQAQRRPRSPNVNLFASAASLGGWRCEQQQQQQQQLSQLDLAAASGLSSSVAAQTKMASRFLSMHRLVDSSQATRHRTGAPQNESRYCIDNVHFNDLFHGSINDSSSVTMNQSVRTDPRLYKDDVDIKFSRALNSCKLPQIRYASKERLFERLTDLRFLSIDFLNTFLLTYRVFTTAEDVLEALKSVHYNCDRYYQLQQQQLGRDSFSAFANSSLSSLNNSTGVINGNAHGANATGAALQQAASSEQAASEQQQQRTVAEARASSPTGTGAAHNSEKIHQEAQQAQPPSAPTQAASSVAGQRPAVPPRSPGATEMPGSAAKASQAPEGAARYLAVGSSVSQHQKRRSTISALTPIIGSTSSSIANLTNVLKGASSSTATTPTSGQTTSQQQQAPANQAQSLLVPVGSLALGETDSGSQIRSYSSAHGELTPISLSDNDTDEKVLAEGAPLMLPTDRARSSSMSHSGQALCPEGKLSNLNVPTSRQVRASSLTHVPGAHLVAACAANRHGSSTALGSGNEHWRLSYKKASASRPADSAAIESGSAGPVQLAPAAASSPSQQRYLTPVVMKGSAASGTRRASSSDANVTFHLTLDPPPVESEQANKLELDEDENGQQHLADVVWPSVPPSTPVEPTMGVQEPDAEMLVRPDRPRQVSNAELIEGLASVARDRVAANEEKRVGESVVRAKGGKRRRRHLSEPQEAETVALNTKGTRVSKLKACIEVKSSLCTSSSEDEDEREEAEEPAVHDSGSSSSLSSSSATTKSVSTSQSESGLIQTSSSGPDSPARARGHQAKADSLAQLSSGRKLRSGRRAQTLRHSLKSRPPRLTQRGNSLAAHRGHFVVKEIDLTESRILDCDTSADEEKVLTSSGDENADQDEDDENNSTHEHDDSSSAIELIGTVAGEVEDEDDASFHLLATLNNNHRRSGSHKSRRRANDFKFEARMVAEAKAAADSDEDSETLHALLKESKRRADLATPASRPNSRSAGKTNGHNDDKNKSKGLKSKLPAAAKSSKARHEPCDLVDSDEHQAAPVRRAPDVRVAHDVSSDKSAASSGLEARSEPDELAARETASIGNGGRTGQACSSRIRIRPSPAAGPAKRQEPGLKGSNDYEGEEAKVLENNQQAPAQAPQTPLRTPELQRNSGANLLPSASAQTAAANSMPAPSASSRMTTPRSSFQHHPAESPLDSERISKAGVIVTSTSPRVSSRRSSTASAASAFAAATAASNNPLLTQPPSLLRQPVMFNLAGQHQRKLSNELAAIQQQQQQMRQKYDSTSQLDSLACLCSNFQRASISSSHQGTSSPQHRAAGVGQLLSGQRTGSMNLAAQVGAHSSQQQAATIHHPSCIYFQQVFSNSPSNTPLNSYPNAHSDASSLCNSRASSRLSSCAGIEYGAYGSQQQVNFYHAMNQQQQQFAPGQVPSPGANKAQVAGARTSGAQFAQVTPGVRTGPQNRSKRNSTQINIRSVATIRVLSVLRHWVSKHSQDFVNDTKLSYLVQEFLQDLIMDASLLPAEHKAALQLQQMVQKAAHSRTGQLDLDLLLAPPTRPSPDSIETLSALEIAEGMTYLDHKIFLAIRSEEFLGQAWMKMDKAIKAPHILLITKRFNDVSRLVSSEIIRVPELHRRVAIIEKWTNVAHICRVVHNFNGVLQICAAFTNSAVFRLKKTWDKIPKTTKTTIDQLQSLVSTDSRFRNMRDAINRCDPPSIPYVGMYLTDLSFIEEGTPNYSPDGLLNFSKMRMIAHVIREIQHLQNGSYKIELNHRVANYLLDSSRHLQDDEMYRCSLAIEPRSSGGKNGVQILNSVSAQHNGTPNQQAPNQSNQPKQNQASQS